ncbi:hypothetical protein AAF712_004898 [Marasmius tenuissimus]|uniref:Transmembrane protein n=1 Tax=Marasmius tenuissimus TaxID=585030 RepID=A0ABR3A215_9AGAR
MSAALAKAGLIGTLLECTVYGIYTTVFLQTLPILHRKVVPGFVFAYLASTTLILFVLITVKLGVDIKVTVGLLTPREAQANSVNIALAKISYGIYVSVTMIADVFIVYRVFAVWSRSLVVSTIPGLLSLAGIISGGLLVANASKLDFKEGQASGLLTTFYCTTLALNVLCTALIAFKLYISDRQTKLSSTLKLRWTSVVVIESAAIYLACATVVVVCNVAKADDIHLVVLLAVGRFLSLLSKSSNPRVYQQTPSMVGLTFSLIIVRVGSRERSNKTLTSADISRDSVLQFATRQPQTTNRTETELDTFSSSPNGGNITVVTRTSATVEMKSVSCATVDDVESQLIARRDTRDHRQLE